MKRLHFTLAITASLLTACQAYEPDSADDIRIENYTQAFVRQFGAIDPLQNWGFESTATSRAYENIDVNYNDWKNPPLVKEWEINAVMEYLRDPNRQKVTVSSINLNSSYFVTQVGSSEQRYEDGQMTPSSFTCKEKMNNLKVAHSEPWSMNDTETNWAHINNFNTCENRNHGGNTVVKGGGSYHFAYCNSIGGDYYDDYIIIPGSEIDYRLSAYYYICFDFYANKHTTYTMFDAKYLDNNNQLQTANNIHVDGIHKNGEGVTIAMVLDALKHDRTDLSYLTTLESIEFKGYQEGHNLVFTDGIYDDWVIRVVGNAVRSDSDEIPVYPHDDNKTKRIFVEDLAVLSERYDDNYSDWDFNDLVFDAKFVDDGNGGKKLKVVIRAVGGTLPIYIVDQNGVKSPEIHSLYNLPTTTMINTGDGPDPGPLDISSHLSSMSFVADDFNAIRIVIEYNGREIELDAPIGGATSKLCVPSYLANPLERVNIKDVYQLFPEYVKGNEEHFWEHVINTTLNQ